MVAQTEKFLDYVVDKSGVVVSTTERERIRAEEEDRRPQLAKLLDKMYSERISLRRLQNVDIEAYQRDPEKGRIKRIRSGAFWVAFGAPLVSKRADGTLWVIDGQHRVAALRAELGDDYQLLCVVVEGLTREQESRGYDILNNEQKKPSSFNRWKSGRTSGNAEVKGIDEVVASLELEVCRGGKPDCIPAPGSLRTIWRQSKAPGLEQVLRVLKAAWYGERECFAAYTINGLSLFLRHYALYRINEERLIERLGSTSPRGLKVTGNRMKQEGLLGTASMATLCARSILVVYNGPRKTKDTLPAWDEAGTKEAA